MRFETSGELRRVDLTPLVDLVPTLWEEWAGLRFDATGALVNPISGAPVEGLSLLEGAHRRPGARYLVSIETGPAPREREQFEVTLTEDGTQRLACTVAAEQRRWTADLTISRGPLPRVEVAGRHDLTAALRADGTPGCLAGLMGGIGTWLAVVDAGALDRGGRPIEAEGRVNRFRGDARVEVRTSAVRWTVEGRGNVRARGLGRPVLWFTGRRIRTSLERAFAEGWAASGKAVDDLDRDLARLRADVAAEGGPAPFVHRALWDDTFDTGLDKLRPPHPAP